MALEVRNHNFRRNENVLYLDDLIPRSPLLQFLNRKLVQSLESRPELVHSLRVLRIAPQLHAFQIPGQLDFSRQQQDRMQESSQAHFAVAHALFEKPAA